MKNRRYILSLNTLIVGVLFMAASTGITIIIHDCQVCHDFYVRSGIFLDPAEPEDDCCEAAETHCPPDQSITIEGTCCHFSIHNIRLDNYTPSFNFVPALNPVFTDTHNLFRIDFPDPPVIARTELHNKHGGRFITTYNHQLIC